VIDRAEIRARARRLGLDESHVEHDYALCHVLVAISEAFPELVFRGGTSLARVYWPDYRLSEDLDFTSSSPVDQLEGRLQSAIEVASKRTTLDLMLDFGASRNSWSRSVIRWADHELLLDVNSDVETALGSSRRPIDLPYRDLQEQEATVEVFALPEIMGNKWYMLNERREPRDLFDIWAGLARFGVPFDDLDRGHRARYRYPPSAGSLYNAKSLEALWETRLAHQLADLPPFGTVYREVKREFQAWSDRQD